MISSQDTSNHKHKLYHTAGHSHSCTPRQVHVCILNTLLGGRVRCGMQHTAMQWVCLFLATCSSRSTVKERPLAQPATTSCRDNPQLYICYPVPVPAKAHARCLQTTKGTGALSRQLCLDQPLTRGHSMCINVQMRA